MCVSKVMPPAPSNAKIIEDEDDVFTQGTSLKQLLTHGQDAVYVPRQRQAATFNMRMWALCNNANSNTTANSGPGGSSSPVNQEKARKKMQQWVTDDIGAVVVEKPFFDYTFNNSAILSSRTDCTMRPTSQSTLQTLRGLKPGATGSHFHLSLLDTSADDEVDRSFKGGASSCISNAGSKCSDAMSAFSRREANSNGVGRRVPEATPAAYGSALQRELQAERVTARLKVERIKSGLPLHNTPSPQWVKIDHNTTAGASANVDAFPDPRQDHHPESSSAKVTPMNPSLLVSVDAPPEGRESSSTPFSNIKSVTTVVSPSGDMLSSTSVSHRQRSPTKSFVPSAGSCNALSVSTTECSPSSQRHPVVDVSDASSSVALEQSLMFKHGSRLRRYFGDLSSLNTHLRSAEALVQAQLTSAAAAAMGGRVSPHHGGDGGDDSLVPSRRSVTPATAVSTSFTHIDRGGEVTDTNSYAWKAYGAVQRFRKGVVGEGVAAMRKPPSPTETPLPLYHNVHYDELLEEQRILLEQRDIHNQAYEATKEMYKNQTKFVEFAFEAMTAGDFLKELPITSSAKVDIPELELAHMRLQRDAVPVMVVNHDGM